MKLSCGSIRFSLIFFLVLCLTTAEAFAADQPTTLSKISAKITELKNFVLQKQESKATLQDELSDIEQQIATVTHKIYGLDKSIEQEKKQLKPLQVQQEQLQQKLTAQRQALATQLQAAYQMGEHSSLQLFLSQQQPSDVARMANYYQAFNAARETRIENFLASLAALTDNQKKIAKVLNDLQALRNKRVAEQKVLQQKMDNRKVLLQKINQQIKNSQQRISQLEANKQHLQKVVNNLAVEKHYENLKGRAFTQLKHRLPWPINGKITRRYGEIYDGRLRSNGVFLSAPLNSPVRAIASGTVIFANWLRGYGNMIIVSHKGNYMTLYGHNNALLVSVGQQVNPGEEIALVGNSGGLIDPGLYFEIRFRGKTRDPALWCR